MLFRRRWRSLLFLLHTWVVDVIASFCFKSALLCVAVWLDTLKRRFFRNGSEHFNFFHPHPLNPLPPISMLSFRMEVARTSSRGRSKKKTTTLNLGVQGGKPREQHKASKGHRHHYASKAESLLEQQKQKANGSCFRDMHIKHGQNVDRMWC